MKYIFIPIWALLIIVWTLIEGVFICVFWLIYVIWNFKVPEKWWSRFNSAMDPWDNRWGGYEYEDKNIWQTIKRRLYDGI